MEIQIRYFQAIGFASKRVERRIAEDFGAYCAVQWLEGRSPKTSFAFMLVDFFRDEFGRDTKPELRVRAKSGRGADALNVQYRAPYDGNDEVTHSDRLTGKYYKEPMIEKFDLKKALDELPPNDRAVFMMRHKYGLDLKELADCFGVVESRMSQRLSEIHSVIAQALSIKKLHSKALRGALT